jgi:hypothetical protein
LDVCPWFVTVAETAAPAIEATILTAVFNTDFNIRTDHERSLEKIAGK